MALFMQFMSAIWKAHLSLNMENVGFIHAKTKKKHGEQKHLQVKTMV